MKLDRILSSVEKPARYTGGELNTYNKEISEDTTRFVFCFPDVYEVGMSYLGLHIIYNMINERKDAFCERLFSPWPDMEEKLRENDVLLFSLESQSQVKNADILAFTLQYEMSYSNILNILALSDIPILSKDRKDIFVYAGGPCAYNPEPLADIMDFFMIGEGEEIINEVLDEYSIWKNEKKDREEFLIRISKIKGIYVPSFYKPIYNEDNTINRFEKKYDFLPDKIEKRIIKDMNKSYYPKTTIVPYIDVIHNRAILEMFRGCIRGCRFCQAGMIYRPVREKSIDTLLSQAKNLIENTGHDEISLSSLSTSDYSQLHEFLDQLINYSEKNKINLSLPSLRVDNYSVDLMNKTTSIRKSGLTFAPEAGSQRLRDVINKQITKEDLLNSMYIAFKGGYSHVKLYFMMGLPSESDEDIIEIANLASELLSQYYKLDKEERQKSPSITISVSCFVPKAFTPFQFDPMDDIDEFARKQKLLKDSIKDKKITFNYHDSVLSVYEGVFARGDRKLGKVLIRAHELGVKFDGWNQYFNIDAWNKAFEDENIDKDFYTKRLREYNEVFPWEIIDCKVTKKFLVNERIKALKGEITPNCRANCMGCGLKKEGTGVCVEHN